MVPKRRGDYCHITPAVLGHPICNPKAFICPSPHHACVHLLQRHWDTFLTRDDLEQMHDFGITHVRIPVGYWLLDWRQVFRDPLPLRVLCPQVEPLWRAGSPHFRWAGGKLACAPGGGGGGGSLEPGRGVWERGSCDRPVQRGYSKSSNDDSPPAP